MRIVCPKFRDYYDGVQALGQDRELVYVRDPQEVDVSQTGYPFPHFTCWGDNRDWRDVELHITNWTIGFCGQLYPCLQMVQFRRSNEQDITEFCYKIEEVDEFVEKNFKDKVVEDYHQTKHLYNRSKWPWDARRQNIKKFWDEFALRVQEQNQDKIRKHFEDNRSPVFLGKVPAGYYDRKNMSVTYNARLKDVQFARIVDPYRAFQEISMWLGNQAEPRKAIPEIDDVTMAEAKGFDKKTSFRKPSSKKK
jgi:hypothetical protein